MNHVFLSDLAKALSDRNVATLRYQFPYMEEGGKRPDRPEVAQQAVRAAVTEVNARLASLPVFAGGKSFGGRMTTQAQAVSPLPKVRGLILVGFPLHPTGKPSLERAAHLSEIAVPMLFLQGTRDSLAELQLMREALGGARAPTNLYVVEGADHAFHVLARSGRKDSDVLAEIADQIAIWIERAIAA